MLLLSKGEARRRKRQEWSSGKETKSGYEEEKCMALRRKLEIKIGGKKTNENLKSYKEIIHV